MTISAGAIDLIARLCLVAMFPFSALDKLIHWKNAMAQTLSGRPVVGPVVGAIMLGSATAVEAITPFCIVFGIYDRTAAILLAGFCVASAVLYHPFWAFKDFWSSRDDSVAREHFWQFLKNFGLVGGLLLIVFAGSMAAPESTLVGRVLTLR